MKKTLAVLLIAVLMLGICFNVATASVTSVAGLSTSNDDEPGEQENLEEEEGETEHSVKGEERKEAQEAIDKATREINEAQQKIDEAESQGANVMEAEDLLSQAETKIDEARTAFDDEEYEEAKKLAKEAEDLAGQAKDLAEEALEGPEEEMEDDAREAIREAGEEIQKASDKIEEAETRGFNVTSLESLLNEANSKLSQAEAAYRDGNYEEAEQLAEEAEDLAERAKKLAEDLLKKEKETEWAHEQEDEEEDDKLEVSEEDDDVHIRSEDSRIRLEREEPKIRFEYYVNNKTKVKFKARFRSLIEFADLNNDGKIQDDEVLRELDLEDISWTFTYENITEEDNTLIRAVYYANSTAYEITIIARIYQRAVIESDTIGDRTLVYDVDGGADEAKFDIIITRWTWISDQSQLAVLMKTEAEVEVEGAIAWSQEAAGIDEEQITLSVDDVEIKITWVTKAKIVWRDGSEVFEDVTVAYESWKAEHEWEEDGEEEVGVDLKVYFIYPNFGDGKLIHDPSIGIEDDPLLYIFTLVTPELLIGTGITAIAIATAAIALTRRRKRPPSPGVSTTNWYIYRVYTPIAFKAKYERPRKSS
jgi:cellobiose-specific phosphotransferase system component IIA